MYFLNLQEVSELLLHYQHSIISISSVKFFAGPTLWLTSVFAQVKYMYVLFQVSEVKDQRSDVTIIFFSFFPGINYPNKYPSFPILQMHRSGLYY